MQISTHSRELNVDDLRYLLLGVQAAHIANHLGLIISCSLSNCWICALEIAVIDTGKGMKKKDLAEVRAKLETDAEQYEHNGLGNINKRLKLVYGSEYGLKIRSKFNFGTVVSMRIPKTQSTG